jgi:hypothetical protein
MFLVQFVNQQILLDTCCHLCDCTGFGVIIGFFLECSSEVLSASVLVKCFVRVF